MQRTFKKFLLPPPLLKKLGLFLKNWAKINWIFWKEFLFEVLNVLAQKSIQSFGNILWKSFWSKFYSKFYSKFLIKVLLKWLELVLVQSSDQSSDQRFFKKCGSKFQFKGSLKSFWKTELNRFWPKFWIGFRSKVLKKGSCSQSCSNDLKEFCSNDLN